jgi:HEAT repeat protein
MNNDRTINSDQGSVVSDLELNIQTLLAPYGHAGNQRDRERALAYLLAHADEAHPRLLDLLDPASTCLNPVAVIDALPAFSRPESIPVLEKVMETATEAVSLNAGQALARHPHREAAEALTRGLRSQRSDAVISAADGLLTRGEKSSCAALIEAMVHSEREIRYRVLQAAGGLGCLTSAQLQHVAKNEPEQMIRDLAIKLLQNRA